MSIWKFLGLAQEPETVRKIVAALDRMEPGPRYPPT